MKCEEKVFEYCREKIAYNKVFNNKVCDRCCLYCLDVCPNICKTALSYCKERDKRELIKSGEDGARI